MNQKTKSMLTGVIIAIVTGLLLRMVGIGILFAISIGIVIGIIVASALIARSRGERPKDVVQEVVQESINPNPDALKHRVEEQLIRLNEKIRIQNAPNSVVGAVEKIIDLLLEVVPRALSEAPSTTATFDLEKMSTDYLPDLINRYLTLSGDDQKAQEKELLKQLIRLEEIILSARDSLDAGNLDEFHVSSEFIKAKTV